MGRLLLVSLSVVLFSNALLVIFMYKVENISIFSLKPSSTSKSCNCSSLHFAEVVELSPAPRPTVNYSHLASETPQIASKRTKYTRIGTQLEFDPLTCPQGSLRLERDPHFVPAHLDCPTVFIVGARKAGTSSLYVYLSKHPQFKGVLLDKGPQVGETFYFSSRYHKWSWSQYMELFGQTGRYMTGECSVGNFVKCHVPERLWQSCGKQARVVILLREPIKRLESNFLMRVRLKSRGYNNNTKASTVVQLEVESFLNAVLTATADFKNIEHSWERFRCLFNPSRNLVFEGLYYVHLMNWLCNFPPENILFLNSEEFFQNTAAVFEEVVQFLGLSPLDRNTTDFITSTAYNQARGSEAKDQRLSKIDRKQLKSIYKHINRPLFKLLGWENLDWS